ncbi:MAG: hypothetical protein ABIY55_01005 [Kofleriaceae bacterium]
MPYTVYMRYLSLALLLLILYRSMGQVPTSPPPPSSRRGPPTGRVLAVVSTSWRGLEGSNMGGEHYVFRGEVEGTNVVLHGGGHGVSLGLLDHEGGYNTPRWFLAEVELGNRTAAEKELEIARHAWGVDLPRFDGEVLAMVPTANASAAEQLRAELVAMGSPTRLEPFASRACIAGTTPWRKRCPVPAPSDRCR